MNWRLIFRELIQQRTYGNAAKMWSWIFSFMCDSLTCEQMLTCKRQIHDPAGVFSNLSIIWKPQKKPITSSFSSERSLNQHQLIIRQCYAQTEIFSLQQHSARRSVSTNHTSARSRLLFYRAAAIYHSACTPFSLFACIIANSGFSCCFFPPCCINTLSLRCCFLSTHNIFVVY